MRILQAMVVFLRAMLAPRSVLATENLALRQQLAVYQQSVKRPKLLRRDRICWVWLSRLLVERAIGADHRAAANASQLAPSGFQVVWVLEVPPSKDGTTSNFGGNP
jgi:hypothetical protein